MIGYEINAYFFFEDIILNVSITKWKNVPLQVEFYYEKHNDSSQREKILHEKNTE